MEGAYVSCSARTVAVSHDQICLRIVYGTSPHELVNRYDRLGTVCCSWLWHQVSRDITSSIFSWCGSDEATCFHGTQTNMRRVSVSIVVVPRICVNDRVVSMLLVVPTVTQQHTICFRPRTISDGFTRTPDFSNVVFATLLLDCCLPVSSIAHLVNHHAPRTDHPRCQE